MFGGVDPASAAKNTTNVKRVVPGAKVDAGGVFGSMALGTNINLASKHWLGALGKMRRDANLLADCSTGRRKCKRSIELLAGFIERSKDKPVNASLLNRVNRYTNRNIRYTSDRKVFGRDEYWAGPSEVMGRRGDCEDYVIAKYFILSKLGVSDRHMKVVVVRDLVSGLGHAVLAVKIGGRTLILDNQSSRVRDHLKISRYQPLYSINKTRAWLNLAVKRVAPASILTRQQAKRQPVRVASLQSNIVVHLARRKPVRFVQTDAGSGLSQVHF